MPSEQCKEILDLLSEYLDGELPEAVCVEIETHVTDCEACNEFLRSLRRTVEMCREFKARDLPGPLPRETRDELMEAYRKMLAARKSD